MLHSNFTNKSGMQKLRDIAFKQLNESQRPTEADEKAMKELKDKREARARAREEEFNPKPKPPRGKDEVNPGLDSKSKPRRTSESKPEPKPQSNKPLRGEVNINKPPKKKYNTIEENNINLKDYFKERLMEEIAESFMTDAQRETPAGKEMQLRHAGKIKDLMSKFNDDPERFRKSPNAASRLRDMGTRVGMNVKVMNIDHGGYEPKRQIMHGVINPKPVSSKFGSENKISIQDTNEVDRRDAHQMLRDDRKERLKDNRSKQAKAAKEKEEKSWEV